jgi:hypothetical protein
MVVYICESKQKIIMKAHMQIANTIWQQLNVGTANRMRVGSWGTHALMGMKKEGTLGTLRFKVKGEAWGSTKYDEIPETVHELKDIYCDQLTELIDEYVEKTASHKY